LKTLWQICNFFISNINNLFHFFKKPEYYFRLRNVFKKFLQKSNNEFSEVSLVWGDKMYIKYTDNIGKSIYKTGIYDLALSDVLWRLCEPGSFVIDVGANIGYTTLLLSKRIQENGQLYCFEPNPKLIPVLEKNISHMNNSKIRLYPIALSDKKSSSYFEIPKDQDMNDGIGHLANIESDHSVLVQTERLDQLIDNENIELMKIDVEGYELNVLHGAEQLLMQKKIKHIVFEEHDDYPTAVTNYLEKIGYKIFRINKGWFKVNLQESNLEQKFENNYEPTNYIATVDEIKLKRKMKEGIFYSIFDGK